MAEESKKVLIDVVLTAEEAIKNMAKAQTAMQKLRAENKDLSKNYEENSDVIAANNIQIKNLQASIVASQKVALANTATTEGSTGAYRKAELQLAVLNQKAKDLAITYGSMDERAIEASNAAKALNDRLKEVDGNIGRNERTVGDYKNQIIAAVKELTDLKTVTAEMEAEQKRLEKTNQKGSVEYKILSQEIENNQSQIAKLEGGSVSLSEKLDSVGGAGGQVIQTTKGMNAAFKALIASPVVLVLTAIVGVALLLWKAFNRNEESTNKLNRVTGMLTGMFNGLLKTLEPLANFIVDKLIGAFEFGGKAIDKMLGLVSKGLKAIGLESAAKGLDNLTDSIKKNADAGAKLADAEAKLQVSQRESRKIQLEYQRLAEKQRQIRDDESKSIKERIAANTELGKILKKQSADELSIANQAVAVAKMKIEINGKTTQNLDELAAKETEVIDIKERITGQESEQLANLNSLRKESKDKQLQIIKEKKDAEKIATEKQEKELEKRLKDEADALEKKKQQLANDQANELKDLSEKYAKGKKSATDYEKEKFDITQKYRESDFNESVNAFTSQLELQNLSADQRKEIEKAIFDAKSKYAQESAEIAIQANEKIVENEKESAEKRKEIEEQLSEKKQELFSQLQTTIQDITNGAFERKNQELDEETQKISERYDSEIESAGKNEKQAKALEAEKQKRLEEQDKKKRKLIREQAIIERAFQAFSIGVSTAKSVGDITLKTAEITAASALNPLLIPSIAISAAQIPIALGIGALQLASVMAAPLPKAQRGKVFRGNSHAMGGIPVEVEGDEMILTKGVYRNPVLREIASMINQAGGGISLASGTTNTYMATGGVISNAMFNNDGGYAANNSGGGLSEKQIERAMTAAISKMKPQRVAIEDIRKADEDYTKIEDSANF